MMKTNKELYSFIKRLHRTLQCSGKTLTQEIILSELKQDNNESHKLPWIDELPAHKITCSIIMKYYKQVSSRNRVDYLRNNRKKIYSSRYFDMVKKLLNRFDNINASISASGLLVKSNWHNDSTIFNLVKGMFPELVVVRMAKNAVVVKYPTIEQKEEPKNFSDLDTSVKNINSAAASLRSKIREKEISISLLEEEKKALETKYEKLKGSIKW